MDGVPTLPIHGRKLRAPNRSLFDRLPLADVVGRLENRSQVGAVYAVALAIRNHRNHKVAFS